MSVKSVRAIMLFGKEMVEVTYEDGRINVLPMKLSEYLDKER